MNIPLSLVYGIHGRFMSILTPLYLHKYERIIKKGITDICINLEHKDYDFIPIW